jgi:hypothetical protein
MTLTSIVPPPIHIPTESTLTLQPPSQSISAPFVRSQVIEDGSQSSHNGIVHLRRYIYSILVFVSQEADNVLCGRETNCVFFEPGLA